MNKRIFPIASRIMLILLAIFFAVCIVAFAAYMIVGSLEMYPTPETVEEERVAVGAALVPVCMAEFLVLKRLFRKK